MAKRERTAAGQKDEKVLDLTHLRRETRTALELAVVALAPSELIDRLAKSAGLLEAIAELPTDSAPVVADAKEAWRRRRVGRRRGRPLSTAAAHRPAPA